MEPAASSLTAPELGPDAYARWRNSELGVITERLEDRLLFDLIGDPHGQNILEVGCGDGALAASLTDRNARVVGIDPSLSMIRAAAQRAASGGTGASFCVAKAENLPFASEQFDLVIAKTILCFVDDATGTFAEISRVLRPGGHLVIGELGKWSSWAAQRFLRGRFGSSLWRRGHFWTATELRNLAVGAGLAPTSMRGAIYYPRSRLAARMCHRTDRALGHLTTIGAAFIAMSAAKA